MLTTYVLHPANTGSGLLKRLIARLETDDESAVL